MACNPTQAFYAFLCQKQTAAQTAFAFPVPLALFQGSTKPNLRDDGGAALENVAYFFDRAACGV